LDVESLGVIRVRLPLVFLATLLFASILWWASCDFLLPFGTMSAKPPQDTDSQEGPRKVVRTWEEFADGILEHLDKPIGSNDVPPLAADASAPGNSTLGSAQTSDPEWAQLPRSKWRFAAMMLSSPDTLAGSSLFRHVQLNPRDIYIAKARRDELVQWLDLVMPLFTSGISAIAMTTEQELGSLIATGAIQPMQLKRDRKTQEKIERLLVAEKEHRRNWSNRGFDYVEPILGVNWIPGTKSVYEGGDMIQSWRRVGASFFGANREQMPLSAQLWAQRDALSVHFASRIALWFVEHGTLTSNESDQLLQQAMSLIEDPRKPR
jgi:hypothetical protein